MAALRFFFGFNGRLARGRFWIFGLALYALATLALAADPVVETTLESLVWVPGSIALLMYIFTGMWGFSVAVLTMAIDVFIVQASNGVVIVGPFLVGVVLSLVLGWMVVAVAAKRLHDRGKSGWWLLLFVVAPLLLIEAGVPTGSPVAQALFALEALALHVWSFIELGCRRGMRGENAHGPDPLEAPAPAAALRTAG